MVHLVPNAQDVMLLGNAEAPAPDVRWRWTTSISRSRAASMSLGSSPARLGCRRYVRLSINFRHDVATSRTSKWAKGDLPLFDRSHSWSNLNWGNVPLSIAIRRASAVPTIWLTLGWQLKGDRLGSKQWLANQLTRGAGALALLITIFMGGAAMARDLTKEDSNKALVQASFDRWRNGAGGPFELLESDAEWTIVGSSPLAKTYRSKKEFIDDVIDPLMPACLRH
jgi:hypothetical protein